MGATGGTAHGGARTYDGEAHTGDARDGVSCGGVARGSVVAGRVHEVHRGLGELLEAVGRLDPGRVWSLREEALGESIREVYALEARLAAMRSALLAQAEHSGLATGDAHANLVAWLRERVRLAPAQARRQLMSARGLGEHPEAAAGLAQGAYPEASATVITGALDALPADLVETEVRDRATTHLVDAARTHDTRTLARLAAHLGEVLDPEGADRRLAAQLDAAEARAARETFLTLTHDEDRQATDGTFRVPLHTGVALQHMIESLTNPARPDPIPSTDPTAGTPVPAARRRGEAFAQLIDRTSGADLPRTGGSTTTVVVTMALHALHEGLAAAHLDTGHRLAPATARRLAAAHGVIPAVLGTEGEVLDVGRRARLFTRAQRLALNVQQHGTCAAQGCDRPAAWGDAHHLHPWSGGGPTDLSNGVLLCPRHHTLAHRPGYDTTVLAPGRIRINRRE